MAKKRVLLSIDDDLNNLWNEVAKKHRITKSGMVEHYLRNVLNELNHANISDAKNYDALLAIKEREKGLFDAEYDQSIYDYKEMKLTGNY